MARKSIGDVYSISPWMDWVGAALLTTAAGMSGVGMVEDFGTVAVAVSTLSGIFAAVAVFACGAAYQSSALILRIARAALPSAMRRSWVSIIFGLLTAAGLPILALYVHGSSARIAEVLVLGAVLLNIAMIIRVAWWVSFVARAQDYEDRPRHRTTKPGWMKDNANS